eukprot:5851658-Pleurochrysis_carterae.AAC.1
MGLAGAVHMAGAAGMAGAVPAKKRSGSREVASSRREEGHQMNVEKHPAALFKEGTNQSHPSTLTPSAKKKLVHAWLAGSKTSGQQHGSRSRRAQRRARAQLAGSKTCGHHGSRSWRAQWCATDESPAGSETFAQHGSRSRRAQRRAHAWLLAGSES